MKRNKFKLFKSVNDMEKDRIINNILRHIEENGGVPEDWYVGITSHIQRRKEEHLNGFNQTGYSLIDDEELFECFPVSSEDIARAIEDELHYEYGVVISFTAVAKRLAKIFKSLSCSDSVRNKAKMWFRFLLDYGHASIEGARSTKIAKYPLKEEKVFTDKDWVVYCFPINETLVKLIRTKCLQL